MLLPIDPPEDKGITKFMLGIAVSLVILGGMAWAATIDSNFTKLWERITHNEATVNTLHEGQALTHQELQYIEEQLDDIKQSLDTHNKQYHSSHAPR